MLQPLPIIAQLDRNGALCSLFGYAFSGTLSVLALKIICVVAIGTMRLPIVSRAR